MIKLSTLVSGLVTERKDYEIYHKSYTSACNAAREFAAKKGYDVDEDHWESRVTMGGGGRRPSTGKTTSQTIQLLKNGKPVKHMLAFQVYGMESRYELNAYIS